jgi:proteasome lid subunit RPN8/RPN11
MHEIEDYEDLETYDEEPSRFRKPLLVLIGLFLLALILSYFFLSDAIFGVISSETLEGDTLYMSNYTVIFESAPLELLQKEYVKNEHREIKACLYGGVEGRTYTVEETVLPEIMDSSVIHIKTAGCAGDPIITLHSHPVNKCLASEQDIENYKSRKGGNPDLLLMVMCGKDRFAIVDRFE